MVKEVSILSLIYSVVYSWERQTHWDSIASLEYLEARSSIKSIKYAEGRNAHLLLQRK